MDIGLRFEHAEARVSARWPLLAVAQGQPPARCQREMCVYLAALGFPDRGAPVVFEMKVAFKAQGIGRNRLKNSHVSAGCQVRWRRALTTQSAGPEYWNTVYTQSRAPNPTVRNDDHTRRRISSPQNRPRAAISSRSLAARSCGVSFARASASAAAASLAASDCRASAFSAASRHAESGLFSDSAST